VAEILGPQVFKDTVKAHLDKCFGGEFVHYEMTCLYPNLGERQLAGEHT
jgi:hypothetical protein